MAEDAAKDKAAKRKRREITLIVLLLGMVWLIFFFQTHVSQLTDQIPVTSNILVISLIGLNIILLLLLVFLILRNVV
ncbi:MAG: hypothetical protein AMJ94_17505, partial [Deltaproteobacteria bacterium SM23_61]